MDGTPNSLLSRYSWCDALARQPSSPVDALWLSRSPKAGHNKAGRSDFRNHPDPPILAFFLGKKARIPPKKGRIFLTGEPLKSLEKRAKKTHKKARKTAKRRKRRKRKKQGLEGQGSDWNPIWRKCGKCGRSLSPQKNKGLRRFHGAKTRSKNAENADTKTRKMRLTGFNVTGFR